MEFEQCSNHWSVLWTSENFKLTLKGLSRVPAFIGKSMKLMCLISNVVLCGK